MVLQLVLKHSVIIYSFVFFLFSLTPRLVTVDTLQGSLVDTPVSGLMGLAFPALSATNSVPFWLVLTNDSQLSTPEFSIWLGRDRNQADQSALVSGGAFTLGGTNSSLFSGEVQFTDIALPAGFWQVSLTSKYSVHNKI